MFQERQKRVERFTLENTAISPNLTYVRYAIPRQYPLQTCHSGPVNDNQAESRKEENNNQKDQTNRIHIIKNNSPI